MNDALLCKLKEEMERAHKKLTGLNEAVKELEDQVQKDIARFTLILTPIALAAAKGKEIEFATALLLMAAAVDADDSKKRYRKALDEFSDQIVGSLGAAQGSTSKQQTGSPTGHATSDPKLQEQGPADKQQATVGLVGGQNPQKKNMGTYYECPNCHTVIQEQNFAALPHSGHCPVCQKRSLSEFIRTTRYA